MLQIDDSRGEKVILHRNNCTGGALLSFIIGHLSFAIYQLSFEDLWQPKV